MSDDDDDHLPLQHPMKNVAFQSYLASFMDTQSVLNMSEVSKTSRDAIMNYSEEAWHKLTTQANIDKAGRVGNVTLLKKAVELRRPVNHVTALRNLYNRGKKEDVLSIFDMGLDVNTNDNGRNMMAVTIFGRDIEFMKELLKRGLVLNPTEAPNVIIPLEHAVTVGDLAMIELLLDHGADPNRSDNGRATVLLRATMLGNDNIMRLLLRAGADPNLLSGAELFIRSVPPTAPLLYAVKFGRIPIVKVLLEHGANPNASDVIKTAVENKDFEMVQVLLKAGASTTLSDGTQIINLVGRYHLSDRMKDLISRLYRSI